MVAAHFGVRFGRNWAILVSISVEIGLFWRLFQPESARIGLNWRESENEKKEKKDVARTRSQWHHTLHAASVHIGCGCSNPGATPVLSSN